MKKFLRTAVSLTMAAAMVLATGCGARGGSDDAAAGDGEAIELKLAHIYSTNSNEDKYFNEFKNRVEEQTGGAVTISIFPNSQLGSEAETMQQVVLGTIDIAFGEGSSWANAVNKPELGVFGLPYLCSDLDGQAAIMREMVIQEGTDMMVPTGIRPLFSFSGSIRHAILATDPIYTLEDCQGVKMRVPEVTLFVDTWKNLGSNPTTTPWGDVYTAISQGVVDGAEVDACTIVDSNLQEVTKYYSKTGHISTINIAAINEDKWQSIPTEYQDIILKVGAEVQEEQVEARKVADDEAVAVMEAAGVVVNELNAGEYDKMVAAQQPMYDQYANEYGLGDMIAKLQEVGAPK
ncbi:MAG: TRAP transporter substrate-binding protein [Anaerotignum sp.]|nr:TRAP transporter substrate-binding protein [Anaerotignum sp.]